MTHLCAHAGTLPPELVELGELRHLDLGGNSLGGTLPPQWGQNGSWDNLQGMLLARNALTGVRSLDQSFHTSSHGPGQGQTLEVSE